MFGKSKKGQKEKPPVLIQQASEYAIKIGNGLGFGNLDFSPGSLDSAERVLDKFSKDWTEEEREENIVRETVAWGAYIGETMRRNVPSAADWVIPEPEEGKYPYFTCKANDGQLVEVSPMDKAYKRIISGESESIPFYYKTLLQIINTGI